MGDSNDDGESRPETVHMKSWKYNFAHRRI